MENKANEGKNKNDNAIDDTQERLVYKIDSSLMIDIIEYQLKKLHILAPNAEKRDIYNVINYGYGDRVIEMLKFNPDFNLKFNKEEFNRIFSVLSILKFGNRYIAELNYFIEDSVIEILDLYAKDICDIKKLDKKELKVLLKKFYEKEIEEIEFVMQLKEMMINEIYLESSKLEKEDVLKKIQDNSISFFEINNQLLNDKEIALLLLKKYAFYKTYGCRKTFFFKMLPENLQKDPDIIANCK